MELIRQKVVTFGEIMLRLSTPRFERFIQSSQFEINFGGGEANVAVSLANFGVPVEFVSRLPENELAEACLMTLRKFNVGTRHLLRGGERIGIYFLETGAVARPGRVIYDRSYSSLASIESGMINWDIVFRDAKWFHWTGITPAISENAAKVCLEGIEAARNKGLTISVDLNFRKNLWKYGRAPSEIMPELVKHCDIIIGNEEDAEKIFGIKQKGIDVRKGKLNTTSYIPVCKTLMEKFPSTKKIIVTLRTSINANQNKWSGILWDGKELIKAPEYDITHIVDRVGGGDAFAAGLIYGLLTTPEDNQNALNFATAASCLKHTIHGDFNLVRISEIQALMTGDTSGRVSR